MSGNELCVHIPGHKLRVGGEVHQEVDISGETLVRTCSQTTELCSPLTWMLYSARQARSFLRAESLSWPQTTSLAIMGS